MQQFLTLSIDTINLPPANSSPAIAARTSPASKTRSPSTSSTSSPATKTRSPIRFIPLDHISELEQWLANTIRETRSQTLRRDCLAICLGLHGLCVSEVCRCLFNALDRHSNCITPPLIKRRSPRRIQLHESLIEALLKSRSEQRVPSAWLLQTRPGHRIYPTHLQRGCRKITEKVFGFGYRFHALRHTFAMRLYRDTHDLLLVKQSLGHRSIQSTLIYAAASQPLPASVLVRLTNVDEKQRERSLIDEPTESVDEREAASATPYLLPLFASGGR